MRRFDRLDVDLAATAAPAFAGASGNVPVAVRDLSVAGLFFISSRRFVVGMSIQVELDCQGCLILVDGIVRHCSRRAEDGSRYGIGLQFLNTSPVRGAVPTIAGYIAREKEMRTNLASSELMQPSYERAPANPEHMAALLQEK